MSHIFEFTLGIYGDGQLARLLVESCEKQNITPLVYTLNERESPCRGLCVLQQGKNWTDKKSFTEFAQRCEFIVLENEFVPAEFLLEAEQYGATILPNAQSFAKISNKLKQVELAESLNIKVPDYLVITSPDHLLQVKLPAMLKSLSGGYDGYGNFTFKTLDQLKDAKKFIEARGPALAQEFIFFDQEVAVLVAGDGKEYFSFPVVETIQEKNICHFVLTPPRFSEAIQKKVKAAALKLIKSIQGKGLFGVEFFIRGSQVIFNEIAPRPHNSGHYSIEACDYSQFDALVKLMKGTPLTQPVLTRPVAGMLNLLGTHNGKAAFKGDDSFHTNREGFLHLYGKEDSRIGRKMGHYTLLGQDQETVLQTLTHLKARYEI